MKHHLQIVLVGSTILTCWLGMQIVHEAGHVLGALVTGGEVKRVVLHPLTISRTDLGENPRPLLVVWSGPLFGALFPLVMWGTTSILKLPGAFLFRFFAGFCLVANGAYIAFGSFDRIGDCGEMLRHGSQSWQLWLFGVVTIPVGFWLWHRQGPEFGLGSTGTAVNPQIAYTNLAIAIGLVLSELLFGRP